MSFPEAISTCLKKYTVFDGRASRSEFLVVRPLLLHRHHRERMGRRIDSRRPPMLGIFIAFLALLIPYIAAGVRRLHDLGKSGWWWFVSLIPFGSIVLIVLWATAGNPGRNQYGLPPGAGATMAPLPGVLPPSPPPPPPP
jgi:uncharacterized membrane protein YhaH (DUF805 family)